MRTSVWCARLFVAIGVATGSTVAMGQLTTVRAFSPYEVAAGAPVEGNDGAYYGTLYNGGANAMGAVYRQAPGGSYTLLYSFSGADGANPVASLVIGQDGNFYGTTTAGGANGTGTIFSITQSGMFTSLYSFPALTGASSRNAGSNATGAAPYAALIQGGGGAFYGTASEGGANGWGTIFKYNAGTVTAIHSFAGTDGQQPYAALVQDSGGDFYGVAAYGGNGYDTGSGDGCGTVFKTNASGNFKLLYAFANDGSDGCNPVGGLAQPTDMRTVYGTTASGGSGGVGTVWSFDPSGTTYTQLASFNPATGIAPGLGPLLPAPDGNLYGVTLGANICILTGDCSDSREPLGSVARKLAQHYHATPGVRPNASPGYDEYGTVFSVTQSGSLSAVYTFTGGSDGSTPVVAGFEGSNGSLYGTTVQGGAAGGGTLYGLANGLSPIVTLTSAPGATTGDYTLTWTVATSYSKTANLCYANGAWSGKKSSSGGSATVKVTSNVPTTFGLTCGGNETAFVTLQPKGCSKDQICFSSLGHNFGGVPEGSTVNYGVSVTNNYANKAFPVSISLTGSTDFSQTNNCGTQLAAGAKCEILFSYTAPNTPEYESATINIAPGSFNLNPGDTGTLRAQSIASGAITVNTQKHNFSGVPLGSTAQFNWLISNGTGAPQSISFTPSGDTVSFTAVNMCPSVLPANGSCQVNFTFTPSSTSWTKLTYTLNTGATVTPGNVLTLIGYGVGQ